MEKFKGKVAVHAITWGQEHRKAQAEAAKLGYKAIEPWPAFALQYENRSQELREALGHHGLTMTGLYGGASGVKGRKFSDYRYRQDIIDYNVRLAKIIAEFEAGHLILGPGAPREKPTDMEGLKAAAKTINETAKRTFELGVKACVHPHLWTEIQDENELDTIMDMCDPDVVFFAPDTAHLTKAGIDPVHAIQRYKDQVAYVHLKDLSPDNATVENFPMLIGNEALPVFCELGLGTISFQPIIDVLIDINYSGWLTIEIDQSTSTPYQSLEICRDFVEQNLGIPIRELI